MILVAGGTGTLGRAITTRLLRAGRQVRVLTRDGGRASTLRDHGAEVAAGDLRDPASLRTAVRGATHVVTTANAFIGRGAESVGAVDTQGNRNLIDAAREEGVRQFVFTSALLTEDYRQIDYFAAKFDTETYLRGSGLTYTILRPTAFMETWAMVIGEPLMKTGTTNVFGPGTDPINFVAVDNVADVAAQAVDDPRAFNQTVEIGGPENLTLNEVVATFERARGMPGKIRHLPVWLLRILGTVLRPFNPVMARQMKAGALMGSGPHPFDPRAMLARYPVDLITLDAWVLARYGGPSPPGASRAV